MNDNLPTPGVDASVRPMQLNCPHCQAILTVHPSQAGLVADCPKCSGKFHVPVPMAKPWNPGKNNVYSNDEALSESREFIGKKTLLESVDYCLEFSGFTSSSWG